MSKLCPCISNVTPSPPYLSGLQVSVAAQGGVGGGEEEEGGEGGDGEGGEAGEGEVEGGEEEEECSGEVQQASGHPEVQVSAAVNLKTLIREILHYMWRGENERMWH